MPKITKIHDNIITISGKFDYQQDQLFALSKETNGLLLSASENEANLLAIGDPSLIKTKGEVSKLENNFNQVDVYDNFFGSIITPMGNILHPVGKKPNKIIASGLMDSPSVELLDRVKLSKPLETGIITIDTMIPIGRGQRELIIGDRNTGKSTIAINTIINLRDKDIKTIYVSIGQKRNSVIDVYNILEKNNALKNTIIIFANPDSSAEQFLVPKIGMAMAEAIAYQGKDVLIVFDDLTKHANVYREISLSIGKNPGREAYPTDIFYQHSKLLERAGRFNSKYKNGSITALPIVETIQGDVASLIPSNVISITDGQIFTSSSMFNDGKFPAINVGLSVSRTGSAVQSSLMKFIAKGLKSEYSSLFDIKKFADMSIDISEDLKTKIDDWDGINNILLQFGHYGYYEEQMLVLVELFRMKAMSKIKDKILFSRAFLNYCTQNEAAKKILEKIKMNEYNLKLDANLLREDIKTIFLPLVKVASGFYNSIITEQKYQELRGEK